MLKEHPESCCLTNAVRRRWHCLPLELKSDLLSDSQIMKSAAPLVTFAVVDTFFSQTRPKLARIERFDGVPELWILSSWQMGQELKDKGSKEVSQI
jgi:hypothetical protein